MYKFIKILFHINPTFSHAAYLYQDITTDKYYLSYTHQDSENIIDESNQFMLLNNEPKITKQPFLKHIDIVAEVTPKDFGLKKIHNYII